MSRNEADAVISPRLKGKKMAIKFKSINRRMISILVFEIILHIAENKLIIKTSPFFCE